MQAINTRLIMADADKEAVAVSRLTSLDLLNECDG